MQHTSSAAIMASAVKVPSLEFNKLTVAVFDTETNGLLDKLTTMHLLIVRKIVRGVLQPVRVFRRNHREDTIRAGLDYLADSDIVVGHNILVYDLIAIERLYLDFEWRPGTRFRDTEVIARMVFSDQKQRDFDILRRGIKLNPGSMELEAWGKRLNLHKGDYKKAREELAKAQGITDPDAIAHFVWGTWNQDMEDYGVQDVEVGLALWMKCVAEITRTAWPEASIVEQHRAHDLMVRQQHFGFGFDKDRALQLADTLRSEYRELHAKAVEHFGTYAFPKKLYKLGKYVKDGVTLTNRPRTVFGEDDSRQVWGEVTVAPAENSAGKKIVYKDGRFPGAMYCSLVMKEFKPTSRPAIVNRLTTVHNWSPTEFTEKGGVKVSHDILRPLAEQWPICETLADVFFYQKMLSAVAGNDEERVKRHLAGGFIPEDDQGDVSDGDDDDAPEQGELDLGDEDEAAPAKPVKAKKSRKSSAWLLHYNPQTGSIHHRCVVAGSNSRRATHSGPNVGQTKGVEGAKDSDNPNMVHQFKVYAKKTGGDWKLDTKRVRLGRLGNFGWDSRECFTPPPGFEAQVGIDLSGIEMRALGARLAPFDGGEFLKLVITPGQDVHKVNAINFGISLALRWEDVSDGEKAKAKRVFYAMVYGAGNDLLGSVILPAGTPIEILKAAGEQLKATFLRKNPAFARLLKHIEVQSRSGYLLALDGGRLYVRSKHSALNLQLQSDGALIAQHWMLETNDALAEDGLVFGVDYGQMAYVHDEDQYAAKTWDLAYHIGDRALEAAERTGEFYSYGAPIAAEARVGANWAQCH